MSFDLVVVVMIGGRSKEGAAALQDGVVVVVVVVVVVAHPTTDLRLLLESMLLVVTRQNPCHHRRGTFHPWKRGKRKLECHDAMVLVHPNLADRDRLALFDYFILLLFVVSQPRRSSKVPPLSVDCVVPVFWLWSFK